MAAPRHDYRPSAPGDKYGLPGIQYPTPNIDDIILVEDVPIRNGSYAAVEYQTPHPNNPTLLLAWQGPVKGDDQEKNVRRIYAAPRYAQASYNADVKYSEEAAAYPIFVRSFIILRSEFIKATVDAPLTEVVALKLTAAGTGYSSLPTVTFSGGGGSGATARVEWNLKTKQVASILLTRGGTGYTSAPTVTIVGGGGSGATATVSVQPATAVLVHEEHQPAPEPIQSIFDTVVRVYETLPGPITTTKTPYTDGIFLVQSEQPVLPNTLPDVLVDGVLSDSVRQDTTARAIRTRQYLVDATSGDPINGFPIYQTQERDAETGVNIYTDHFLSDDDYVLPSIRPEDPTEWKQPNTNNIGYNAGAPYSPKHYVIAARKVPREDSPRVIVQIEHCQIPLSVIEVDRRPYVFPAVFAVTGFYNDGSYTGKYPQPWAGDSREFGYYTKTPVRQIPKGARVIKTFSLGRTGKLPEVYAVVSPGAGSKVYPIDNRTIHGSLIVFEIVDGQTNIVENIASSTPSAYNSYDILTADAEEPKWRGPIYCQTIRQVSESRPLSQFPDVSVVGLYNITEAFKETAVTPILGQPSPPRFLIVSTTAGGTGTPDVTIYGKDSTGHYIQETVQSMPVSTVIGTNQVFASLESVLLSGTYSAATLTVSNGVEPAYAQARFVTKPLNGYQLKLGPTGSEIIYTFRTTPAAVGDIAIKTTISQQMAAIVNMVSGIGPFARPAQTAIVAQRLTSDTNSVYFTTPDNKVGSIYNLAFVTGSTISSVTVNTGGTGYESNGTPGTFTGGGTGATAMINFGLTNESVTLTPGTTTYSVAPTVTITSGGGTGATAVATLSGGVVNAINVTAPGTGFTFAPTVTISGGTVLVPGTASTATGNALWFTVVSVVMTTPGSGYTSPTNLIFPSINGVDATFTVNLSGASTVSASSIAIINFQDGADGQLLASLAPGIISSFNDISFDNPTLNDNSPDNDRKGLPNLAAQIVQYSDWIACPTTLMTLILNATGTPPVRVAYQVAASTTLATTTKTVSVVNGSAAITITGGSPTTQYVGDAITIPGDASENEITAGTAGSTATLLRTYTGTTGTYTATITTAPATTVANLSVGGRKTYKFASVQTGFIRLKFSQSPTSVRHRAVLALLRYAVPAD